jgi:hypothetical protein
MSGNRSSALGERSIRFTNLRLLYNCCMTSAGICLHTAIHMLTIHPLIAFALWRCSSPFRNSSEVLARGCIYVNLLHLAVLPLPRLSLTSDGATFTLFVSYIRRRCPHRQIHLLTYQFTGSAN